MNIRQILPSLLAIALAAASCGYAQTDEEQILSALENVQRVANPQQDRTVLVYSKASSFVHRSIPVANAMLKLLGEKTGAFTRGVQQRRTGIYARVPAAVRYGLVQLHHIRAEGLHE